MLPIWGRDLTFTVSIYEHWLVERNLRTRDPRAKDDEKELRRNLRIHLELEHGGVNAFIRGAWS